MNFVVDGMNFCTKRIDSAQKRIKIRSKQTVNKQPKNLTVRDLPPIDIQLLGVILLPNESLMF